MNDETKIYTGNIDSLINSYVLCLNNIYSICSGSIEKKLKRSSIIGYVSFNENVKDCDVISFLHENNFIRIINSSRFILTKKGFNEVGIEFINLDPRNITGIRTQVSTSFDINESSIISQLLDILISGLIFNFFEYSFFLLKKFLREKIYNKYFNSKLKECFMKNLKKDI